MRISGATVTGAEVRSDRGLNEAIRATRELVANREVPAICEATFVCCWIILSMVSKFRSSSEAKCVHSPCRYLALKWQNLDWTPQTASVVRSVRKLDGRWCFSDTKRSRSRRPIRLQSWVVGLLRDLQTKASAQDLYPEARDRVFRTQLGQPTNADYLAKQFRSILDAAGVLRMRLYDLRHSAATIALAAGVSPKVVSEQLGHASTAFTLDTYAHVLPHMQDEAAAKVEALLFRQTA